MIRTGVPAFAAMMMSATFACNALAATPVTDLSDANFSGCNSNACVGFNVSQFNEVDGPSGSVGLFWIDNTTSNFLFVSCVGAKYANALTVNSGTGKVAIVVTIDGGTVEDDSHCFGQSSDGTFPVVTINVSGEWTGESHESTIGIRSLQLRDTTGRISTTTSKVQKDCFSSESYSGSISLIALDNLQGSACASRAVK